MTPHNFESSTYVTFPGGSVNKTSHLVAAPYLLDENETIIFVEKTPFYPINYKWPDQPSDRGYLSFDNRNINVRYCIRAAYEVTTQQLYLGENIPKFQENDLVFHLVGHVINTKDLEPETLKIGDQIALNVDASYRRSISRAHTGAHFMSLALNKAIKPFWKKDIELDALGSPNFDRLAIEKASIQEDMSIDCYRLGKSIKKKGLDKESVFEHIKRIESDVNSNLMEIISSNPRISINPKSCFLDETRCWHAEFNNKTLLIPCGGTHLLDDIVSHFRCEIIVDPENPQYFTIKTRVFYLP